MYLKQAAQRKNDMWVCQVERSDAQANLQGRCAAAHLYISISDCEKYQSKLRLTWGDFEKLQI